MADEEQSTCICDTYVHHCWEGLWFFFFLLDFGVSERYVYLKWYSSWLELRNLTFISFIEDLLGIYYAKQPARSYKKKIGD